jgi:biotin carboxylase
VIEPGTSTGRLPISKTLLVVGGGIEAIPGLQKAKNLGLHVVVSDADPEAPGFRCADDRLIASTYNIDETVAAASKYHRSVRPIEGVMCIASDIPLTVASVAHALNLTGIPLESARLASEKLAMKEKFAADNVPVPWFAPVDSAAQVKAIAMERGFPLVIKPVDSRGARGVQRLTGNEDLDRSFELAARESPGRRVMIEQFLDGPQVSSESIMLDGVAHTPGFADRNYELLEKYAPNIVEDGCDLPTVLGTALQQSVREVVEQAAISMGIRNGVVKGDIVVHKGRAYVIELAARLSGGLLCSDLIPLNTGVDFVENAIRLALGEPVPTAELIPRFQHCVCQRYLFPRAGRVVRISGEEDARKQHGIVFSQVRVRIGSVVGPMNCHPARAGMIIAVGESREQAAQRARTAVETIEIDTVAEADAVEVHS